MDIAEKLNPKNTALIVIDIQVDFCSPLGLLGIKGRDFTLIDRMLKTLPKVIELATKNKVLTLYTQQIYDPAKINNLQKEQYELDGKLVTCDIATNGYDFYKINPPMKDVYIKHNFNAFSNPQFQKRLEQNNIKTLLIAGVDTQFCVETAIRNGYDLGYKIVVLKDCIATNAKHSEIQDKTLELVTRSYGVVITSEDLDKIWK